MALAKPGHLLTGHHASHVVAPLAYVKLVPGAPLGHDGRVVDTPEVAHAKAEHEAAHVNEKINLAHEAHKSADHYTYSAAPAVVATSYHSNAYASLPVVAASYHAVAPVVAHHVVPAAPLGHDGRVVDTPEVAHAKAAHAAAHAEAKSAHYAAPQVHHVTAYAAPHHYNVHHAAAPLVSVW